MKDPKIDICHMALDQGAEAMRTLSSASGTFRELEIIFYGMVCFDPLTDRPGYRVLFPNALTEQDGIPVHSAGIWVRDRDQLATARWSWFGWRNDFFLNEPRSLSIAGLTPSTFGDADFNGHVTNLQDCDPSFQIRKDPDTAIDMVVDHGVLSAHVGNTRGMIIVRWLVQVETGVSVRFNFGNEFVEVPPTASQVFLANAGSSSGMGEDSAHFMMYRRLSTEPKKALPFQGPRNSPQAVGSVKLKDPTFQYIDILCPDIVCSAVQSRLR